MILSFLSRRSACFLLAAAAALTGACAASSTSSGTSSGDGGDGGGGDMTTSSGQGGDATGCGDGVADPGEACDDGNQANTDACVEGCVPASCGDGYVHQGVETCDDGNDVNDDACTNECKTPSCGDGIVQVGEPCDDGNTIDTDACLSTCAGAACGDGFVQQGVEQCDDGNMINGDGCDTSCTNVSSASCIGLGGGISVLANPDFETGSLMPWVFDSNLAVTLMSHSGSYAAESNGNHYLEQTFNPVPVSSLVKASFWTWHDGNDDPPMYVEWSYSDNTIGFMSPSQLSGWVEIDLLPLMDQNKSLTRLQVWGYESLAPLPDIARFDDFRFCY